MRGGDGLHKGVCKGEREMCSEIKECGMNLDWPCEEKEKVIKILVNKIY